MFFMLMDKCIELTRKYVDCPACGNGLIGENEGGIVIEEYTFDRWCKCGWKVHVDLREEKEDD